MTVHDMDYLLGEITVDGPDEREEAVKGNGGKLEWPEGWWAVSDDQFAYLAFFQYEHDAFAFRLLLINTRMNLGYIADRYEQKDQAFVRTFQISGKELAACPLRRLDAAHYREDGTCKCKRKKSAKTSSRSSKRASST